MHDLHQLLSFSGKNSTLAIQGPINHLNANSSYEEDNSDEEIEVKLMEDPTLNNDKVCHQTDFNLLRESIDNLKTLLKKK